MNQEFIDLVKKVGGRIEHQMLSDPKPVAVSFDLEALDRFVKLVKAGSDLRDEMAKAAMQGLLAGAHFRRDRQEDISINAYIIADAMLRERTK